MKNSFLWFLLFVLINISYAKNNILILTIDTFRPDFLTCYNSSSISKTPNIDRIAEDGVLFTKAYSTTAWTSPGLISVLTGMYPTVHNVTARGKSIPDSLTTVFEYFKRYGYVCEDISYLTVIQNFSNLGLDRSYKNRDKYLQNNNEILFKYIEEYDNENPFLLWFHHRDLHLPYEYDKKYLISDFDDFLKPDSIFRNKFQKITTMPTIHYDEIKFAPSDVNWIRELYAGQIRKLDKEVIGPLITLLKEKKIYDSTLIIITADHGEELLEHGFVGHGSTSLKSKLYNEISHIPLIIKFPGNLYKNRRIDVNVSQIDIFPTLIDYFHLAPVNDLQGISLMKIIKNTKLYKNRLLYAETNLGGYQAKKYMLKTYLEAIFDKSYKLIRISSPDTIYFELYNEEEDSLEQLNIIDRVPNIAKKYEFYLNKINSECHILAKKFKSEKKNVISGIKLKKPIILIPQNSDHIKFSSFNGAIKGEWTGPDSIWYILEYRVGSGKLQMNGKFRVFGNKHNFGPFYKGLWNTLSKYNPWIFYVYPEGHPELKSRRLIFYIDPVNNKKAGIVDNVVNFFISSREIITPFLTQSFVFSRYFLSILFIFSITYLLFLIKKETDKRKKLGLYFLFLSLFCIQLLFYTLGIVPLFWEYLYRTLGVKINFYFRYFSVSLFVLFFGYILYKIRQLSLKYKLYYVVSIGILFIAFWTIKVPATYFHLFVYFIISMSFYNFVGFYKNFKNRYLYFIGLFLIGLFDELIQFYLPIRYFGFDDIIVNELAILSGIISGSILYVYFNTRH